MSSIRIQNVFNVLQKQKKNILTFVANENVTHYFYSELQDVPKRVTRFWLDVTGKHIRIEVDTITASSKTRI